MSYYITINIGGEVSSEALTSILEAASIEGLSFQETGEDIQSVRADENEPLWKDAVSFLGTDGHLSLFKADHDSPDFELVEDACQRFGVAFNKKIDGDSEAEAHTHWWDPATDESGSCMTTLDGEPVLTLKSVAQAVEDGTLARLMTEATIPTLAPFAIKS